MKNLMVVGNAPSNPSGGYGINDGVGTSNLQDSLYEDIFFDRCQKAAIWLKNAWSTRINRCIFEYGNAEGILVNSGEDVAVTECKFMRNVGDAINANCLGMAITGNKLFTSGFGTACINLSANSASAIITNNKIAYDVEMGNCVGIKTYADWGTISNNVITNSSNTYTAYGIMLFPTSSNNNGSNNLIYLTTTLLSDTGTNNAIGFNGNLTSSSSIIGKVGIKTSAYQMLYTDDSIVMNSSLPVAVTLTASPAIGQKCTVLNYGTGQVTAYGSGGAAINGSATLTLATKICYIFQYIAAGNWMAW